MSKVRIASVLGLVALVFILPGCAGEPSSPTQRLPAKKAVQPSAPGQPTLGDVVDETIRRREVIEQLEEIEKAEP